MVYSSFEYLQTQDFLVLKMATNQKCLIWKNKKISDQK
ncbi:hypothetical protein NU08_2414 [Flavobacterium anhuiense]|uniref:Uncharacterized protein n=1 Tax=Flavobacterium anhuiense TaxID=459526 RepID=A0A444VXW3_9FLAO|nr:hypothetical protein NU08_2414 [Flavobacterium anhuiense]